MSKKITFKFEGSDEDKQIWISPGDETNVIKETILDAALLEKNYLVLLYKPDDLKANVTVTYDSLDTGIKYIVKLHGKIDFKLFFTFRYILYYFRFNS